MVSVNCPALIMHFSGKIYLSEGNVVTVGSALTLNTKSSWLTFPFTVTPIFISISLAPPSSGSLNKTNDVTVVSLLASKAKDT